MWRSFNNLVLLLTCSSVGGTQSGSEIFLNWPSIGVAWALSTATIIVAYIVLRLVKFCRKRGAKRLLSKNSNKKYLQNLVRSGDTDIGTRVEPLLECGSSKDLQLNFGTPRSTGHVISMMTRESPSLSNNGHNRRKRDDVTLWCNKNGLPESFVEYLRASGFEASDALCALRPQDIASLSLPSAAMVVQLRRVLELLQKPDTSSSTSTSNSPRFFCSSLYHTRCNSESTCISPDTEGAVFMPQVARLQKERTISVSDSRINSARSSNNSKRSQSDNGKGFHGLLSNAGLWVLTNLIGHEWRQLATYLGMSAKIQEQLIENHPHDRGQTIYEMLQRWRDNAPGSKAEMKGSLHSALISVRRRDIADMLSAEQVKGSIENVGSPIKSLV